MATADGITEAIGCLSIVFPEFLATEIARLTDEVVSATQAVTDPLAAVANTNVQGLVDDAATLASGSIVESTAAIATELAKSYVLREIRDRVDAMAEAHPGATKKILQAANTGEKVVASAMLAFTLFRETPFVIAQRMCEKLIELGDLKIAQLQCMKSHILQMNNCVAVLAKAKNEIVDFTAELQRVSLELDQAKRDLRIAVITSGSNITIDESALARAVQNIKDAEAILNPRSEDLTLLTLTNTLTFGSISTSQLSEANIKLATLVLPHLNFLLEAEMSGVEKVTEAINFHLEGINGVLENFSSSAKSNRAAEIRARTIQEICAKVESVKAQIDSAIANRSTKNQTRLALLWASQLQSMAVTANKVQSSSFAAGSNDESTATQLNQAYEAFITTINQIDSENVVNAVDNVFDLKVLVTNIRLSGNKIIDLLDERTLTDQELTNFTVLVAEAATGGNNRIEESIEATRALQAACESFINIEIPFREDYERLITLFDALKFDRGKDLLEAGRIDQFLDQGIDGLSYLMTAVNCLTQAIRNVDDVGTRAEIRALRDELQSRRSNELLTTVDNLNFGGTKILDRARAELERFQQKQETAKNLVSKLEKLADDLGFAVGALDTGFQEMKSNLERLEINAGGRLSADLDEFLRRPGGGVPIC